MLHINTTHLFWSNGRDILSKQYILWMSSLCNIPQNFLLLIAWAHISLTLYAKVGFSFITKDWERDEVISLPDPESGGTDLVKNVGYLFTNRNGLACQKNWSFSSLERTVCSDCFVLQWKPLIMITSGPALFDNSNRLITLSGGYKSLHYLTQFIVTTFYMYKKQQVEFSLSSLL